MNARGILFFLARVLLSLALLAWIIRRLDVGADAVLDAIQPRRLLLAAVVFAASTVLGALQWTWVLRHAGIALSVRRGQVLYWIGLFVNNFLPSSVGGDVVKVADVAVSSGSVARPIAATLLDRLLGLLALVVLATGAALLLGGRSPAGVRWWMLALVAVPVVGVVATLLSRRAGSALVGLAGRIRPGRGRRLAALVEELHAYRLAPGFLLRILSVALVVQALRIGTHLTVARELGLAVDVERLLEFFVLIPVLGVIITVSPFFNGLGIREGLAARLMPAVGIGPDQAVVLQLCTYLVQVAVSLGGGILFAWQMARGRLARRPSSPGSAGS